MRSWTAISFDDVAMRFAKQSGFIGLEMIEEPMSADEAAAVRNTIPAADGAADTKVGKKSPKSGKKRKATSPAEATDAVTDEPEPPPPPPQPPQPPPSQQASTSEQNASYIKALEKKLRHIRELRQREQQGFELDGAQRQKLGREAELLSSLEAAQRQEPSAQIDPKKASKKPKRKRLEAAAGATLEGEEEGGAGEAQIRQPAGSPDLFASLTAELQAAKEAKAEAARRERELLTRLAAERKAGTAAAKKAAKKAKRAATQGADADADADAVADADAAVEDVDMSGTSGADGARATALVSEAWAVLGLHEAILGRLAAAGFKEPTPIQRECLPAALHGRRDVIGAAEVSATDDP